MLSLLNVIILQVFGGLFVPVADEHGEEGGEGEDAPDFGLEVFQEEAVHYLAGGLGAGGEGYDPGDDFAYQGCGGGELDVGHDLDGV